jgi:4-diphosphocytidyl-2-C-methyl-D-erythritol kinase
LICTDAAIASDNSVMKAAKALWPLRKNKSGVQIKLHKKVPYQAGLGSASSDAAAALVWLNQFWECGLGFEDLHSLAEGLGSDVPFFLYNQPCCIEGRGEKITPLKRHRPLALLLIKPKNIFIATASAYGQLAQRKAYAFDESKAG